MNPVGFEPENRTPGSTSSVLEPEALEAPEEHEEEER